MPCPAWCGTCKADADYCGDPIRVSYTEAESGRLHVEAVTTCRYHTPGDRWDSPYTFDDLTERLLVELERRWVA